MSTLRRPPYFNDEWRSWNSTPNPSLEEAYHFHQTIPNYKPTPLHNLKDLARELGVKAIYLKDEGDRFGLPAFKVLGASWGTFRALARRLDIPPDSDFASVKTLLEGSDVTLFAATDGNHGRAVARIASWLGLGAVIFVPSGMHAETTLLIESEGAKVVDTNGSYDDAVLQAEAASKGPNSLLIQDFAFGDYTTIPQVPFYPRLIDPFARLTRLQWIVDGYHTMMVEIDEQLGSQHATHVFAPVGAGSFAQAVTNHFRASGKSTSVIGVEADTAACLRTSLDAGQITPIITTPTIMSGLDCGTVSKGAWPILSEGLSACVTVSDVEADAACVYLKSCGISAGPCGASPVAALRRLSTADRLRLGIGADSIIVLPCTESERAYEKPLDGTVDES